VTMNLQDLIEQAIRGAALPGGLRFQIHNAIGRLNHQDRQALMTMLRTATGASLGALLVQFLSSRGLLQTGAGAMAGGLLGFLTAPRFPAGRPAAPVLPFFRGN